MAVNMGLIVVGDEILSGRRQDKHVPEVIRLLSARGMRLGWVMVLPDNRDTLTRELRLSFSGDDVVFCCGGIGSTPDDHTRQAAAAALGVDLVLHPEAAALITRRCAEMAASGHGTADMDAPENRQRLKMGEFPRGASLVPNPYNRIPGFSVARHWFVPGFPVMAWPMLAWVLDTHLRDHFHANAMVERSLLVFDTPESLLVPVMEDVETRFPGVTTFSLPSVGDGRDGRPPRRHVELGVKGGVSVVEEAFSALRDGVAKLGVPRQEPG
jgi:molybdopterin-biosynthesis enzyme MoeA-like protein